VIGPGRILSSDVALVSIISFVLCWGEVKENALHHLLMSLFAVPETEEELIAKLRGLVQEVPHDLWTGWPPDRIAGHGQQLLLNILKNLQAG